MICDLSLGGQRTARGQRLKGMFKIFNVEASFLESAISRSRFVVVAIVCNGSRRQPENILSDPSCEPFPDEQINTNHPCSVQPHTHPIPVTFRLPSAQQRHDPALKIFVQDHVQRRQGLGLHDLATGVLHPPVAEV